MTTANGRHGRHRRHQKKRRTVIRCPHCDTEMASAMRAIRKARRLLGQCIGCGTESSTYRCFDCRVKHAEWSRKNYISQKRVLNTANGDEKRST